MTNIINYNDYQNKGVNEAYKYNSMDDLDLPYFMDQGVATLDGFKKFKEVLLKSKYGADTQKSLDLIKKVRKETVESFEELDFYINDFLKKNVEVKARMLEYSPNLIRNMENQIKDKERVLKMIDELAKEVEKNK